MFGESRLTVARFRSAQHEIARGDAVRVELQDARCTDEEADYLRAAVSDYFRRPVERDDIVWRFSGVRPLFDDGSKSATASTRDYVLRLDAGAGEAPLLNVYGGKITTYRRLAEAAMARLAPFFPKATGNWTAGAPLPGGDFPPDGVEAQVSGLLER